MIHVMSNKTKLWKRMRINAEDRLSMMVILFFSIAVLLNKSVKDSEFQI